MSQRSDTPGSRTFTEIANDIVAVRESLYDCTGSAFLAGEKSKRGDGYVIYQKLCAANNTLWGLVEELQSLPSATLPLAVDVKELRAEGWGSRDAVIQLAEAYLALSDGSAA